MQKTNKKFYVILIIFVILFSSCKTQRASIVGFWESDKKILEFGDDYFVMYNIGSSEVIGYKGSYVFAENPSYAIKMTYKEFLSSDGLWESLEGTELEEYTDILLFRINNDVLETKVLGNGKWYSYSRIEDIKNMIIN